MLVGAAFESLHASSDNVYREYLGDRVWREYARPNG